MGLDAGVLGGIRLRVDDEQVPLAPRLRLLFALLVAAGESGVDADLLLEELYAGRPPPTAPAALRVHLAKLRDALEPGRDRAVSTRVGRSHDRWRLRLEPDECDATLFTAEVGQARALLDQGDHRSAVGLLQTALARWGEPYDGLPGAFFETERGRLAGLRRTAAVDLVHSLLEIGEATTARDEAGRLRADDPWDEELMLLQARATYAASGQEPALSLLRDFAQELDEELGLEPSPWLREAEQAVLRHDPAWAPVTVALPRAATPAPTGSRLIGRDALLGQVRAQLGEGRSVLLHGEAGIGKTSLLRQLHRDVPDAVLVSAAAAGTPYSLLHDLLDVHAGAREDPDWADFRSRRRAPDETGDLHLLAEDLADRYLVGSAVLMVDDAETVDLLSLQLLRRLVGRGTQLVVARRPGRRLLREWSSLAPVELQVGPLSDDETRQLVARIRPGAVLDDDQLALIGGVPLLAEHAVSTELGLDAVGERLLAPLGEEARAGARTLAVVQTPVPVAALSSLVGTEAVEELLVSRVLEVHGDRIRFLHPRLEEGLRRSLGYVGCTAVLRDVLESGWDAPALVVADAVEEHEPALPPALVARWALAAGQESLLGGDLDGAARHLERAATDDDPARAREARTLLARSLVAAGRIVDARLLLMPLMDELRAEGLDEELARCIDDYIGMLRLDGGEMHVVERHTRWLLGRDRLAPDRRVAVLDALTRSVDVSQLAARTEELLAECERAGSPYSQFCALEAQWRLSHYRGEEPTRRARFAMQALDLAAQLADTELEVRMTRHLLDDLVALGWGEELATRLARLEEISRTRRHAQARWWVQLMSVDTLLRRGKAEDALLAAREAHDAWPRVPEQLRVELLQLQSLVILFVLGDWEQLAAALHDVTDGPDSLWIPDLVPATALLLCRVVTGQAGPDEVATGLDRVVDAPVGWRRVAELALAGRAAVAAGVPAPRLRQALEPYGKCWVTFGPAVCSLGPVATVLSGLATLDGDTGSAKYWAAHARMRCTSMDASWWLSEVPDT